jgi:DUF4097 and DUF4098 domain-containing protein YvlB
MSTWEFPVTEPVHLIVRIPAGDIRVIAEANSTVATVSIKGRGRRSEQLIEETEVSFDGGTLSVLSPDKIRLLSNVSLDLVAHVPAGSSAELRGASADISCDGEFGDLDLKTASGDINAGLIRGSAKLNSASGDVVLAEADGDVTVKTASGDVQVRRAGGDLSAESASGDIRAGQVGGSAQIRTASGDAQIASIRTGQAEVNTVSGDISVAVPPGVGVYLDLFAMTGDVRSDLAAAESGSGAELTVHCRSISGDIRVVPAAS